MKNKTKKIIKISCAILLLIMIQAIGITYAKYFTVENGKGSAEVAKWAFQIAKGGQTTKTIDLAESLDYNTLVDGKIAPGTSGVITLVLDGTGSETGIDYELRFGNEQNKPTNIVFFYDGEYYNSISEIKPIQGNIPYDAENKTKEINIMWNWQYQTGTTDKEKEANDKIDTEEANTITEYTFDVIATGTQSR